MRQLFRLLRIITRGGAQYLPMLREAMAGAAADDGAEVFGTQLLAVALLALPEAEDEAVEFLGSVVERADLSAGTDKAARTRNDSLIAELATELYNPEIEDVITILEAVVAAEKDDLVALGKRLAATWGVAAKTGQLDPTKSQPVQPPSQPSGSTVPTPESSAGSPDPLTSSPALMDGQTTQSSLSPSPA